MNLIPGLPSTPLELLIIVFSVHSFCEVYSRIGIGRGSRRNGHTLTRKVLGEKGEK